MTPKGTVIVTGAAGGIGRAVSRALADEGYELLLLARSEAQLVELRSQLGHAVVGTKAVDLSNLAQVELLKKEIENGHYPVPVVGLAACSGMADGGPIEAADAEHFQKMFATNTISLVLLAQAVVSLCREGNRAGRLVFVNSVEGYMTFPFVSGYSASKHALEAFTAAIRLEHGHEGISTTSVIPGFVSTPIWDKAEAKDICQFEHVPNYAVMVAAQNRFVEIGRNGLSPEKVARAVVKAFSARKAPLRIVVVQYYLLEWVLMRLVPLRFREFLIRKVVGLQ